MSGDPLLARLQAETSISNLRLDGRPSRLVRSQEAYAAAEAREGMIPWSGDGENLIDRFDGRALLDFYRDPDPRAQPPKGDAELELEEVMSHGPIWPSNAGAGMPGVLTCILPPWPPLFWRLHASWSLPTTITDLACRAVAHRSRASCTHA
jgi:hypothetical protein